MITVFSEHLVNTRKAAGFPTAYRFFHDNGGKQALRFSYRQYLLFEQGESLPTAEMLGRISLALKLIPKSPPAGKLTMAWLRTMAGDDAYSFVIEPFLSVKEDPAGVSPLHKVIGGLIKKQPITVEQAVTILSSKEHYKVFIVFENDAGPWLRDSLAASSSLKPALVDKVLSDFSKVGLLKKQRNGSYLSSHGDAILEFPRAEIMPPGLNDRMRAYQADLVAAGDMTWRRMKLLRADAVELPAFYPVLSLSISSASAYEVTEKTRHSAMFAVEAKVVKLFDL